MNIVSKKREVYALLRCEALVWFAFLTVARGPTMSQADRLITPIAYNVSTSDFQKRRFRPVVSKECGICDHRRDPSVVAIVFPRRPRNDLRSKQCFLKILRAHVERSDV